MATNLGSIFGSVIKVGYQPPQAHRQYSGFAGAHGLTAMHLGSRGYPVIITGRMGESGANYTAARAALAASIAAINNYLWLDAADYSWQGETYTYMVFERFQIVPNNGKYFSWTKEGYCVCNFICYARCLL